MRTYLKLLLYIIIAVFSIIGCHTTHKAKFESNVVLTTKNEIFHAGLMYWTLPGILNNQWYAVFTGTVSDILYNSKDSNNIAGHKYVYGKLNVNEILLSEKTKTSDFKKSNYFSSDGFDNFKIKDKVLIFMTEYDGGYGVPNGCIVKLKTFNDSIVTSSKKYIKGKQKFEIINNPTDMKLWNRYDSTGLKHVSELYNYSKEKKSN
jgi:hypothetical protein